ncbi:MAG: methionyl-tRNA formyltransferase [Bacteroidetes bacterium]|nr:methionyl-tRNA formyltransferase [Bacteroidota bacterium]
MKPRIIYMGTPDFAVEPLETLIAHNFSVVGVVTAVDKPAGRGQKLMQSAVKQCALKHNLPLLQPENLKSPDFTSELTALKPDIIIVIAFRMLPKIVWQLPRLGTINIHASLLPQYRGAAPINWAVVHGEEKTGVTSFFINEEIDMGKVILQKEIAIAPTDTAGIVHDNLMRAASELLVETLNAIQTNGNIGIEQSAMIADEELKPAPKINKETCKINWNAPSKTIYDFIRGFSPYPGAWTTLLKNGQNLLCKIFFVNYIVEQHNHTPGTIIVNDNNIQIATSDGFIVPTDVQIEGKKRMRISDCMRGFSFSETEVVMQ